MTDKPSMAVLASFLKTEFPQTPCTIDQASPGYALVRYRIGADQLRPGGTVSGPVMMAAADVACYVAILAKIGLVPLAVTSNLNISFLRKPASDQDILAECRLLKSGRTLAMGDVKIYSEGLAEPVAHASVTYALPASR